jgi:hypothetical protein
MATDASGVVFPGADRRTPSRAQYFSWINNANEGATEEQTLANLEFFRWLKDEFGMQLDIYAFDAGAIDGADAQAVAAGRAVCVEFPGVAPREAFHRKLGDLAPGDVPAATRRLVLE